MFVVNYKDWLLTSFWPTTMNRQKVADKTRMSCQPLLNLFPFIDARVVERQEGVSDRGWKVFLWGKPQMRAPWFEFVRLQVPVGVASKVLPKITVVVEHLVGGSLEATRFY